MCTTSAVAIFASRQAVTVRRKIARNRSSPQRWRIRVRLEWSGTRQWRQVADSLRPRSEKLAELTDEAEPDVLAFMTFPSEHRTKIHSTDEMDKRLLRCRGRMAVARTTSWRRAAPRLEAPPGCLIQALPA